MAMSYDERERRRAKAKTPAQGGAGAGLEAAGGGQPTGAWGAGRSLGRRVRLGYEGLRTLARAPQQLAQRSVAPLGEFAAGVKQGVTGGSRAPAAGRGTKGLADAENAPGARKRTHRNKTHMAPSRYGAGKRKAGLGDTVQTGEVGDFARVIGGGQGAGRGGGVRLDRGGRGTYSEMPADFYGGEDMRGLSPAARSERRIALGNQVFDQREENRGLRRRLQGIPEGGFQRPHIQRNSRADEWNAKMARSAAEDLARPPAGLTRAQLAYRADILGDETARGIEGARQSGLDRRKGAELAQERGLADQGYARDLALGGIDARAQQAGDQAAFGRDLYKEEFKAGLDRRGEETERGYELDQQLNEGLMKAFTVGDDLTGDPVQRQAQQQRQGMALSIASELRKTFGDRYNNGEILGALSTELPALLTPAEAMAKAKEEGGSKKEIQAMAKQLYEESFARVEQGVNKRLGISGR